MLVDEGADIEAVAGGEATPLFLAALFGHLEVVKFLHRQKADINSRKCINRWKYY